MQQQQLAAQLAHHGGSGRQPQLSPTPSDSDSDISLGAHSPPISSPGPLRFGTTSPNPITSFRFGAHSPGPMPAQFRFSLDNRQSSPPTPPNFRLDRKLRNSESPINVDTSSNYSSAERNNNSNSPPIRVDNSPPPPMNLRVSDNLRIPTNTTDGLKIETPLPLRLSTPPQLTAPLRIQVTSPSRMIAPPSPQTHLHLSHPHSGIVRIAPPSPSNNNGPVLHRPFSPRLTWYIPYEWDGEKV